MPNIVSRAVLLFGLFIYTIPHGDNIMLDKSAVFSRCLERWDASDHRTEYFIEHFDEWLSQLPEDIQYVTLELLERFQYYSQAKTNEYLFQLRPKLEQTDSFDESQTIYTPLASTRGIPNSSDDYLYTYKQIHKISKFRIARDLKTYSPEKLASAINVVIVDDYCGSGKSLREFLENNIEFLQNKKIYYLVTYIMEDALKELKLTASDLNLAIEVVYINIGCKAFENELFSENAEKFRSEIKKYSKKLNIHSNYALGKYGSEALVAFHNDTPNNTIGLFWFDSNKYFSIFPREFENTEGLKRPTPSSMKSHKATRTIQNYRSATRRAKYE